MYLAGVLPKTHFKFKGRKNVYRCIKSDSLSVTIISVNTNKTFKVTAYKWLSKQITVTKKAYTKKKTH